MTIPLSPEEARGLRFTEIANQRGSGGPSALKITGDDGSLLHLEYPADLLERIFELRAADALFSIEYDPTTGMVTLHEGIEPKPGPFLS